MEYLRLCKSSELTSQPAISHVFSFRVRTTGPAGQRWMGCIVPPTAAPTVPAHRALSAQPIHRIVERLSSAARPRQVHSQPQALAPSSISMTSHATSPVILKRVQYTYPITHPPLQQPQPDNTPQPPIQCRAAAAAARGGGPGGTAWRPQQVTVQLRTNTCARPPLATTPSPARPAAS